MRAHIAAERLEGAAADAVQSMTCARDAPHGVHDFAVGIQLHLGVSAIAGLDRHLTPVAGEVLELAFRGGRTSEDVIQDSQARLSQPRCVEQPVGEPHGLVAVAQRHQGTHGERRIAQPAISVVPVAGFPAVFGQ